MALSLLQSTVWRIADGEFFKQPGQNQFATIRVLNQIEQLVIVNNSLAAYNKRPPSVAI